MQEQSKSIDRKCFDDAIIQAVLKETKIVRCCSRAQLERFLADDPSVGTLGYSIAVSFAPERGRRARHCGVLVLLWWHHRDDTW